MRVLVTGHDGYIGQVLVPRLVAGGMQVTGLDAYWFEGCTFGDQPEAVPATRLDLRDVTPEHLTEIDAVVHLAAISNDPLGDLHAATTYQVNHHASVRLARAAKAAGVSRFVVASSCSLYGRSSTDAPLDESAEFNPVTPYGESKVLLERDVAAMADDDFSPVFLRNATVYGPSPRLRLDIMVNNLTGHAVTSGRVLVMSDGTPWRPLVHIEDVCRAVLAVLEAPVDRVHNQAFNVGRDSENYRVSEVAAIVADLVPRSRVSYAPGGGSDARSYRVDFSKLAATLPELRLTGTVAGGVVELADAYQRWGLRPEDLTGPRFTRLRRIRQLQQEGRMADDLRVASAPAGAGR